jgi:hypothetical protein
MKQDLTRRAVLFSAAGLALAGCAGGVSANVQKAAGVVATMASALAGIEAAIVNAAGINSPLAKQIAGYIADIQSLATTLASASTSNAGSVVQQVETVVNALVSAAANLPLPPPIPEILMAAGAVLPTIEALVGLLIPTAPPARVAGAPAAMTPDQALLILQAHAAK